MGAGLAEPVLQAVAAAPQFAPPAAAALVGVAVIHAVLVSDRPDTHKAP